MQIKVTLASFGVLAKDIGFFEAQNTDKVLEYVIRSLSEGEYARETKVVGTKNKLYLPDAQTATEGIKLLKTEYSINLALLARGADIEKHTGPINEILSNCEKYKPVI